MLADRLRELRQSRRMTATRLAASAGVSKSFISQLEKGRTSASLDTLERIATALEVPVATLLMPSRSATPQVSGGDEVRVLHSSKLGSTGVGTRLLSDAPLSAHAIVAIPPAGIAKGNIDSGSEANIVGLRGTFSVVTGSTRLGVEVGDAVSVCAPGQYRIMNVGPSLAVALVSARTEGDLPDVKSAQAGAASRLQDTAGPLRLVTMRARRAAERER